MPPHISYRDVNFASLYAGVLITVTTDVPCHCFVRLTTHEPWIHKKPSLRRGVAFAEDVRFCFTVFWDNEQEEAGDTLIHTFVKPDWPHCQTRWFYFWGKVADEVSPSESAFFKYHYFAPPPPVVPSYTATMGNDCQLEHDIDYGGCQGWNAFSQRFVPDHNYIGLRLSVLLTKYDLTRRGPFMVMLTLDDEPPWAPTILWSQAMHSDALPIKSDHRWTSFVLPSVTIQKDTAYRITVYTTPGWQVWANGAWSVAEYLAYLNWPRYTASDLYTRGESWHGVDFKDEQFGWSGIDINDFTFCIHHLVFDPPSPIDLSPTLGTDDCYTFGTTMRLDLEYLWLDYATLDMHAYMRFPSIFIPPGARVTEAYIDLHSYGQYLGSSALRITGIKELDTAAFSTQADADGRPETDAFLDWSPDTWQSGGWYGGSNDPQDIKAIIQEIIDQPGWISGNALAIKIVNTAQGINRLISAKEDRYPAHLHIVFTP